MPTGYTSKISDGISFNDFVLNCARAFGALVTLRDDMSASIPDSFEPSDWDKKELDKYLLKFDDLNNLSILDANKLSLQEFEENYKRKLEYIAKANELKNKYESMLSQVKKWIPPSSEYQNLKDFMISQIEDSIKFDCNTTYYGEVKLLSGEDWLKKEKENCIRSIEYHTKENNEEIERVSSRNQWIKQLKNSLK
jgi:hypothetical protein